MLTVKSAWLTYLRPAKPIWNPKSVACSDAKYCLHRALAGARTLLATGSPSAIAKGGALREPDRDATVLAQRWSGRDTIGKTT
jgi:hypothetical protein